MVSSKEIKDGGDDRFSVIGEQFERSPHQGVIARRARSERRGNLNWIFLDCMIKNQSSYSYSSSKY